MVHAITMFLMSILELLHKVKKSFLFWLIALSMQCMKQWRIQDFSVRGDFGQWRWNISIIGGQNVHT